MPLLHRFSWALVIYTVIIIVWGAWVRISGSGSGCGEHWPLCNGVAVPFGATSKTWVEVSHRYSTALFGLLVLAQILATYLVAPSCLATPGKHPARRWVWVTLFFTITEALIGRYLVVRGLVVDDRSLLRLIVMPLHLINTSLLLFSEVATAESLAYSLPSVGSNREFTETTRNKSSYFVLIALLLIMLTSGAIAALGSHLMPSSSLLGGLQDDLAADSHLAVRLRVFHPFLGLLVPMAIWIILNSSFDRSLFPARLKIALNQFLIALGATVFVGLLTLTFHSPVWLKLSHLVTVNLLIVYSARLVFRGLGVSSHL